MNFEIGASTININPVTPINLAGYNSRPKSTQVISSDLEINSLCIESDNIRVCLVSIDCLYINSDLIDKPVDKITYILNGASHTHFAPGLDKTKQALGNVDEAHHSLVKQKLKKVVSKSIEKLQSSFSIEYFKTQASLNINRRRNNIYYRLNIFKWKYKIENGPNFFGTINTDLHIITFKDNNNEIIAILWNYACHPTLWPKINEISSDFIGEVRKTLRLQYGNNLPILFFQGFSGNIKAAKSSKWSLNNLLNSFLHLPKSFSPFTLEEYYSWTGRLALQITKTLENDKPLIIHPHLSFRELDIPLNQIIEGEITGITDLKIIELYLSKNIVLIGFSAEPVHEYIGYLHKIYKNKIVIPIGCTGDVFGYLPTDKMIKEGGYESKDFFKVFGYNCSFRANIEKVIRLQISQWSKKE